MKLTLKKRLLGFCLSFLNSHITLNSMSLDKNLQQLKISLDALEIKLKKEVRPKSEELSLSKSDQEALKILLSESQARGISVYEFVMDQLLKSGITPSETPAQSPVGVGGPPPPPPPAPPVTQLSGGIVVGKAPVSEAISKPEEGSKAPSQEEILKQLGALSKTGLREISEEDQEKSDVEFLAIFRGSKSIDEIIDKLSMIKDNPLYLKKEVFKEKEKTPLPKGSLSSGLQISRVDIIPLLKRKNNLIFNFFNKNYLKEYLFNANLFTEKDYEYLRELIERAQEQKKVPTIDPKLISDMLFINAFRNATSLKEIIQNLADLESNEQYLKKESFKAALRLPIPDLLKQKSKLIVEVMQPKSIYLKDYLYDNSLFTENDYNALIKLLNQ